MARKNRAKSDAVPNPNHGSWSKGSTHDITSPKSPLFSDRSSRNGFDVASPTGGPSRTPEEWMEFAQEKLWSFGKAAHAVRFFAMEEPDLLEFLITADEDIRNAVHESTCGASFPTTRTSWAGSLSCVLLERFRLYLNRLPPSLVDRKVDETSRRVLSFVGALGALDHITFSKASEPQDKEDGEEEDPFFKKKQSQKKRKAGGTVRARQNTVVVDHRLFTSLDLDLPTAPDEVLMVEIHLLDSLHEMLETLLESFANSELATHAKAVFFKQPLQYVPANAPASATAQSAVEQPSLSAADPGAFPHIRPLGAAKYFDDGVGLGAWPVIVSGRAVTHLRQMQKGDSHVFAMVRKKITELSQGFFSESNQKRLLGLETEVPIYEAKVSRDLRIVYQIDLDTDLDAKVDKQIIKLYGVYTHAQLDNRLWSLVSHYHINRRGREYRRRCLFRTTHRAPGQNVTLPAQFPHEEDLEVPAELPPTEAPKLEGMTDKDFLDLHSLIALEKFIPMSQTLINSILNDSDASHVFHVSAKEKEIIYHQSACFVLGRSGTGKTTSILFKMIGIEKLFETMEEVAKPRQVFVTQSRVLAQRVQEYYQNLVSASSGTLSHGTAQAQDEEQVLADLDDEDAGAFGLPAKYSLLEDKHFPLFLTYDQLCSLLEADFGLQFRRSTRTKAHVAAEQRFAIQEVADVKIDLDQEDEVEQASGGDVSPVDTKEEIEHARRAAVTFEIFVAAYWPRFDYRLTKGIDPALVYSEFLGVIEGSEFALGSKTGALDREAYTNLSHRKSSFASQRDRIYDLYEIYRSRKQHLGGYDAAERTHALISVMNGKVPGPKLDCLYVDEAQDNLLIDIKLLHNLSNNPHGIFMAGDTAQTISAGSSFRFEDLKAFMWRLEEQDDAVRCGKRNAIHPSLFHLAVNYRSHGGIVDCASSVVQLISDLFPYSIDKLNKETGLIDGPKPIFFSGWDRRVVRFEQFLRGETDTKIDFGASQVILVRNEAARDALRAQVGEIGLILTLYESKGLEFDDVLLYNFFEDSAPAASTWRVILHGLQGVNTGPVPRFDEVRHAVICTELKNLYVGLTRARNHCWMWDVSEKADAMKTFWSKQNLIELCGPEDPMPQLSVSSSEADWAKSGRLLFNKRLYPQAMFCFDKADLPLERDIAAAYQARNDARLLLPKSADRQARRNAFSKAANDFLGCAILSKGKQRTSCYLRAGECYLQAESWKSAAEAYFSADEFELAARNFRRAGCFSEAVDVVKGHGNKIKKGLVDEIVGLARLEFLRKAQYQKATELFDDVDEQLEYMEDFGFDTARIHVLELHKRFADAAAVALLERNTLECVRLLLLSDENTHLNQAVGHAVHGLWTLSPYLSASASNNESNIEMLLKQISTVDPKSMGGDERRQVELFQALHDNNLERTVALAKSNILLSRDSEALVCFAHCSRHLTSLQNCTIFDLVAKSGLFLNYSNGALKLARNLQTSALETQRLLGFGPVHTETSSGTEEGDNTAVMEYWIYSSSCMFEEAKSTSGSTEPTPFALGLSAIITSEADLQRSATKALFNQLKSEIRRMHTAACAARYLRPCLDFGIFGNCILSDCGRHEVSSIGLVESDRQKYFNARLRAHVLQVLIAQNYTAQSGQDERESKDIKRIWTHKFYETLFPHFPPLGGILCADPKQVPELNRAANALSRWCEHRLHELDPFYASAPRFFLSEVLCSLELGYRVQRNIFESYVAKLHSRRLVKLRQDLLPPNSHRSIVHDFIDFYGEKTEDTLRGVLLAVQHIVGKPLTIEVNVLVHLLESIGREIIMQARTWSAGGEAIISQPQAYFSARTKAIDGLFVPRSWALDIVQRPPEKVQRGWVTNSYIDILLQVLAYLRFDNPDSSPLYTFNGKLGVLLRGACIIRVCRLLVLVAYNLGFVLGQKNELRQSITRSLVGSGIIHKTLCSRFVHTDSWTHLEYALIGGPLNRGADELVRLSLRNGVRPREINGVKLIVYDNIKPDLENQLSLTGTQNRSSGQSLNPEAKSFVLGQSKGGTSVDEDRTEPKGTANGENAGVEKGKNPAAVFEGLVPSQVNFTAPAPKAAAQRTLTKEETAAGAHILLFYRRHNVRQRIRSRRAIRVIWACYTRHRLRHQNTSEGSGDVIRKLHDEYKRDVDSIECPLLLDKMFRHHEMVLKGPMPHVLVYLRGLERINQRQKDATKKRLQKVQHEELEKVQAKMTTCSALAKSFKKLYPKVQPGSSSLRTMATLKDRVSEVNALRREIIEAFGDGYISAALEAHYTSGVRVILVPSPEPTVPNPPKPELNVEDLGEMF